MAVVAEKAGEMQLSSPQVRDQQDMPANGKIYIAGRGPAVDAKAGQPRFGPTNNGEVRTHNSLLEPTFPFDG